MRFPVVLTLAVILALFASPAWAQDEPEPLNVFNGSDSSGGDRSISYRSTETTRTPGTEEAPFRTLQHAISQIRRGEVIVVRGGVLPRDVDDKLSK
jgi:hypothetical protein